MGLINNVTMKYFHTVISNLKDTLTNKIESAFEVHIGSSEPTSENYKVWINESNDSETIMIPFVDDQTPSTDNTYSSKKIEDTIAPVKNDVEYLFGLTEELSKI